MRRIVLADTTAPLLSGVKVRPSRVRRGRKVRRLVLRRR